LWEEISFVRRGNPWQGFHTPFSFFQFPIIQSIIYSFDSFYFSFQPYRFLMVMHLPKGIQLRIQYRKLRNHAEKSKSYKTKQETMGEKISNFSSINCFISQTAECTWSSSLRSMKKQGTITHDLFQKYEQQQ
jgi:hypothetical protein